MDTQQALEKCFNYFLDHKPGYIHGYTGYHSGTCVYYAEDWVDGKDPIRCAIGCLIPAKYQKEAGDVEGGVETLFEDIPQLGTFFSDVSLNVLIEMQRVHDLWAAQYPSELTTRENFLDYLQTLMCSEQG